MTQDNFGLKGELNIKVISGSGEVSKDITIPNLIVSTGKNFVAASLTSAPSTFFGWMALGTSTTQPVIGDIALGSEIARAASVVSASSNIATFTATYGAGTATAPLTEAGLFNSSSSNSGTMLSHVGFSVVNKGASDTLVITWTVTCG